MKLYYDRRAPEYDDWYLGLGGFEGLERPAWEEEVDQLVRLIAALPPARTLDVACGTGFLTQHLQGDVTGLDQSKAMLEIARGRMPEATFVRGDAFRLPFADASFDQLLTGSFYGHLEEPERVRFLDEARRVAPEVVVVDAALRPGFEAVQWQDRLLRDGSRWQVFKRFFTPDQLVGELGGGETLHAGRWFVVVRSP